MPVRVSSVWNPSHDASRIRINFLEGREGAKSWVAGVENPNQWVMISTVVPKEWHKIFVQGRADCPQWVSKFYISYTYNGVTWQIYNNGEQFYGNSDSTSITEIHLRPFFARSIKLHPLEWHDHIAMRVEAYFKDI